MKRRFLATVLLSFGLAAPALAGKTDRPTVVYGATVGSSTMQKADDGASNKRTADTGAKVVEAKNPATAPGSAKTKSGKKSRAN
jgi:hypothetical protein